MVDQRFEACLPIILHWEGGNDDDPQDSGGRTSRGITQRNYDAYCKIKGRASHDVWTASDAEVKDIYYTMYWLPTCPTLPAGVDLMFFNTAVNSGPRRAAVFLQAALRIQKPSGEFTAGHEFVGPDTLAALAQTNLSSQGIVNAMWKEYDEFYHNLLDPNVVGHIKAENNKEFISGWLNRNNNIHTHALSMISPVAQPQTKETTVTDQTTTGSVIAAVKPNPGADPAVQKLQSQDVLLQIEAALTMAARFLPMLTTFFPQFAPIVQYLPAVEEGLGLIQDFQSKSGLNLVNAIGARVQTIGQHVQTATAKIQSTPSAPVTTQSVPIG